MPAESSTVASQSRLTRRQKRWEARRATTAALECVNGNSLRVNGLESDLCRQIAGIIRHYHFSPFPLDYRDVALALRWLHAHGKVRVRHTGPEYERTHAVTLVRV